MWMHALISYALRESYTEWTMEVSLSFAAMTRTVILTKGAATGGIILTTAIVTGGVTHFDQCCSCRSTSGNQSVAFTYTPQKFCKWQIILYTTTLYAIALSLGTGSSCLPVVACRMWRKIRHSSYFQVAKLFAPSLHGQDWGHNTVEKSDAMHW